MAPALPSPPVGFATVPYSYLISVFMLLQIMANFVDKDFKAGSKTDAIDETDFISDVPLTPDPSTRLQHPEQQLIYTDASGSKSQKVRDELKGKMP